MSLEPRHFCWQHWAAAICVALTSAGVVAAAVMSPFAILFGMPIILSIVGIFLVAAILPTIAAFVLLRRRKWLRLAHFLVTGAITGTSSVYLALLVSNGRAPTSALPSLALFCGAIGGGLAWAYLKQKNQLPDRRKT